MVVEDVDADRVAAVFSVVRVGERSRRSREWEGHQ